MKDHPPFHRSKMITILLLCLFTKLTIAGDKAVAPTPIALGSEMQLNLSPGKAKTLSFKIDRQVDKTQRLFITAESPFNDPFEQPVVTVKSGDFYMRCEEEANDFMGICQIQGKQLQKNREFLVDLECQVQCNLKVSVYISKLYDLQLGVNLYLQNKQNTPLSTILQMEIPTDQKFTQYTLLATPETTEQPVQSTAMFINYGKNPQIPTNLKYKQKSQAVSGNRIGIFLSSKELKAGDKVAILLILAPKMEINLLGKTINGNQYQLYVNEPVYDFTTPDEGRIYQLDLSQYVNENENFSQTILIKFISYSGVPTIEIGIDKQVKDPLATWESISAHSYEITPTLLKQLKNPKQIFIKVTTKWSTNFYLQASVNNKPFIDIEPQVTELFHLQPTQFKNIIFQDENYKADLPEDGIVEYKADLRLNQQSIYFLVRNCGNWGTGTTLGCIINKKQQINGKEVKQSFEQINLQEKTGFEDFVFIFTYNVTKNCQYNNASEKEYQKYYCKFHILIINNNEGNENMKVQVTINKNNIKQWLRQGKVQKGMVMQGNINYYAFQLPSIQNMNRLEFYTTVIQGSIAILVSQQIPYPTMADLKNTSNDIMYSIWGSVIIDKQYLKAGFYYIAVYGQSMTDYNIGVAIQRIKTPNKQNKIENGTTPEPPEREVTQIELQRGQVQQITMPLSKKQSKFKFTTVRDKENIVVDVQKVVGNVEYQVMDQNQKKLICNSTMMRSTGDDQCDFVSAAGHKYVVNVIGNSEQMQIFTILYTTADVCNYYPWNFPMLVTVLPNQSVCLAYKLYELEDIHISLSLTPMQLVLANISIQVVFEDSVKHGKKNQSLKTISLVQSDKVLSKTELQVLCKFGTNISRVAGDDVCRFSIKISNTDATNKAGDIKAASFLIAVENYRGQNVLFEGMSSKVTTDKISFSSSNKYFYYIGDDKRNKDIQILLSTQTQSQYQLSATIVTNQAFIADTNQSLYPNFNPKTPILTMNTTKYLSSLQIPKKLFQNLTDVPILLISVFGFPTIDFGEGSVYVYNLMVIQGNEEIQLGDTKSGTVYSDQFVEYEIQLGGKSISTTVQAWSMGQGQCLKSFIIDPHQKQPKIFKNTSTFIAQSGTRKILLKTSQKFCQYQISYFSAQSPMLSIFQGVPYKTSLKNSNVAYYLYYHESQNSFRVLQMIFSGSQYLYVESLPGGIDTQFKRILEKNLKEFTWVGDVNSNIQIQNTVANYCALCYYVVAVEAHPDADSEILINPYDKPALLKEQLPLRDRAAPKQKVYYEFYPKESFVFQTVTLYGEVSVTILDPQNKLKYQAKSVVDANEALVKIDPIKIKQNQKDDDFFNSEFRYLIVVEGVKTSSYFVQIKKPSQKSDSHKLVQGMPTNFSLKSNETLKIEFYNTFGDGQISLLVEDIDYNKLQSQNLNSSANSLTFTVQKQRKDMLKKQTKSQNTYNLKLQSSTGSYTLSVTSPQQTTISVLLAQKEVNHLPLSRWVLADRPSIFQIYSPNKTIIIEIYSCKDNIEVSGSGELAKLMDQDDGNDNGVVRMEHGNYGGHYVVIAEMVKGEYYIQVSSLDQKSNQISFSISYYLIEDVRFKERNPYRKYGANSQQIKYKYNHKQIEGKQVSTVEFYLARIKNKENSMDQKNKQTFVTYKLYISNNSQVLQQINNCGIGTAHTLTSVERLDAEGMVLFSIELEKLKEIVGGAQSYLIGAEATIELANTPPNHIKELNFIYDIAQLVTDNRPDLKAEPIQETSSQKIKQVALWVVLPFLFAAILLYFAARYLIRSFSSYPTQLMEEDQGAQKAGQTEDVLKNNNDEPKM